MNPDNMIGRQLDRLPTSALADPAEPSPIPPRPIEFNRADPVLRALMRMNPGAVPTDVAFLELADALAAQLDQLAENPVAPDALVRELLAAFGGPQELVAAVHYRFAVQRAGAPGANVAVERQAEAVALAALEAWASSLVAEWTKASYAVEPALEAVVDRRVTVALDNGTLGPLLESIANMTDAATVLVTARLIEARQPTLNPGLVAEARAFIAFAHGVDVEAAIALQAAASKVRIEASNLLAALAG